MRIGINGYYLNTPYSGIGQYSRNLLEALSEIDTKNNYFIFTPTNVSDFTLPQNFKIIVIPPIPLLKKTFFNRFIWEEYQLGYAMRRYKVDVFHGLYQSLPRWSEKSEMS